MICGFLRRTSKSKERKIQNRSVYFLTIYWIWFCALAWIKRLDLDAMSAQYFLSFYTRVTIVLDLCLFTIDGIIRSVVGLCLLYYVMNWLYVLIIWLLLARLTLTLWPWSVTILIRDSKPYKIKKIKVLTDSWVRDREEFRCPLQYTRRHIFHLSLTVWLWYLYIFLSLIPWMWTYLFRQNINTPPLLEF